MWFVHAKKNKTVINLPVYEGKRDAEKIKGHLIKFGWSEVKLWQPRQKSAP